jgi:hypothetical protein
VTVVALPREDAPVVVVRPWRRTFLRCLVLPAVVTAPLLNLVADADHRYNVYWHGSIGQDRPWRLVTDNLGSVPMYLGFGNFRPLGRMLEWSVDTVAYVLGDVTHLPVQVGLRLVSALAAAVLCATAVLFAEAVTAPGRMFAAPPARPIALLPFAFAAGLVAAGRLSTTVLFGGLYFLSAALVLAVAAWVCRGPRLGVLVVLAGAALAVFNEVAALAPPLATAAVLARGGPARSRSALLLWAGFLPVFVPVRILLYQACRGGGCYGNSDLVLGPGVGGALTNRLTAWLPPLQWGQALRGAGPLSTVVFGVAVVVLGLLAARVFVELPRLPGLDRRRAVRLAVAGGSVLLLGAVLGSVNPQTQALAEAGRWGMGWRDSGLTAAGGALLVAGLLGLAVRAVVARAALVVLVLLGAGTTTVNQAYAVGGDRTPVAVLTGAIATEVAQFDPRPSGNTRRCALLDQFGAVFRRMPYSRFAAAELPGTQSAEQRMAVTASMATEQMYGRPFCR